MPKYVTSAAPNAMRVHLLDPRYGEGARHTLCRMYFYGPTRVGDDMPADRAICRACVNRALDLALMSQGEANALLSYQPGVQHRIVIPAKDRIALHAAMTLDLMKEGMNDREIADQIGIGLRTVVRRAAEAQQAIGARTRFQWGYMVGRAEGAHDS